MVWHFQCFATVLALTLSTGLGFAVPQIVQKSQLDDVATSLHQVFRLTRDDVETDDTSASEGASDHTCTSLDQCWIESGLSELIQNIFHLDLVHLTDSLPTKCLRIQDLSLPDIESNSLNPAISITGTAFVATGDHIYLECNATGIMGPPEDIDWFKDGVRVVEDDMRRIDIDHFYLPATNSLVSKLEITQSGMADSGTYVCRSTDMEVISMHVHVLNDRSCNVDDCPSEERRSVFRVAVDIADWVCSHRQGFEAGLDCWADPFQDRMSDCARTRPVESRGDSQFVRDCFVNSTQSLPNCSTGDQEFFFEFSGFVIDSYSQQ